MNIENWKWITENNFYIEIQEGGNTRLYIIARAVALNIRHVIIFHKAIIDSHYTVSLTVEIDISPVLNALTDRSIFTNKKGEIKKIYINALSSPFIVPIQTVSVLDAGFQSPGWPEKTRKKYILNNLDIEKDVYSRFLPWFAERSSFDQLVKLLKCGDLVSQQEIAERIMYRQKKKCFFQKIFSKKIDSSDVPSDGVERTPIREAILGELYYSNGNTDNAKKHISNYWAAVLNI